MTAIVGLTAKQTDNREARVIRAGTLAVDIHQLILAFDAELQVAIGKRYRRCLVKTIYALRDLEESVQLNLSDT